MPALTTITSRRPSSETVRSHGGVDVRLAGDVAEKRERPAALGPDLGGDPLHGRLGPVQQGERAALLGDPAGSGGADPAAGARDEDDPSVESHAQPLRTLPQRADAWWSRRHARCQPTTRDARRRVAARRASSERRGRIRPGSRRRRSGGGWGRCGTTNTGRCTCRRRPARRSRRWPARSPRCRRP